MVPYKVALFARLEAKPGKENEVAKLLEGGLAMAKQEPTTEARNFFEDRRPSSMCRPGLMRPRGLRRSDLRSGD
ncbi:MAG TPA: hypothetical protein VL371_07455 [Gemmataceae bacterium]|jgi:hypothetical protein|nr:hypothetical protein [Gemmataceae bacterium]